MSAFHSARAVESVFLAFLTQMASEAILKLKPSDRNLGNYIRLVNENGGDSKICAAPNQFKDFHRNPLISGLHKVIVTRSWKLKDYQRRHQSQLAPSVWHLTRLNYARRMENDNSQ